jgi:pimeloyl-ACP methyl ester carboxylesterase
VSNRQKFYCIGEESLSILMQFYEYDRTVPLNAKAIGRDETESYIRDRIVFRGAHDSLVPGLLGIPTGRPLPLPCILLVHGLGGNKEGWWRQDGDLGHLTEALLSSGLALLTLDMRYHGERTFSNGYEPPFSYGRANLYRDLVVDSTVEHRLALDYLATRSELDPGRFGVLGYSLGGVVAFALAGVDARIKAAASCSTWPISEYYIDRLGWDKSSTRLLAPAAPQTFAPAIKQTPFLMLNGKADPWGTIAEIQLLFELIGSTTKELILSESAHGLVAEYIPKAVGWFGQYL